jgi:hypothetical protein
MPHNNPYRVEVYGVWRPWCPAFSFFIFYAVTQRPHFIQVCQLLLQSDLSLHFLSLLFEFLKHKECGWKEERIILSFLPGRRTSGGFLPLRGDSHKRKSRELNTSPTNFGTNDIYSFYCSSSRMQHPWAQYKPSTQTFWFCKPVKEKSNWL